MERPNVVVDGLGGDDELTKGSGISIPGKCVLVAEDAVRAFIAVVDYVAGCD